MIFKKTFAVEEKKEKAEPATRETRDRSMNVHSYYYTRIMENEAVIHSIQQPQWTATTANGANTGIPRRAGQENAREHNSRAQD
ncbi:hypothetical protein A0H81_06887 [Grifola frondosa]|uniref:Uncharacterized protein n=1 Tax=Grifola frondosa TaxID=5627 RepID=A0A1C7MA02_GRIFR|nr:hypothetical protein A0H81_06887 [Grifola frondosa]